MQRPISAWMIRRRALLCLVLDSNWNYFGRRTMRHCPRVRRCLPPLLIQVGVVASGRVRGGACSWARPAARRFRRRARSVCRSVGLSTRRLALISLRGRWRNNFWTSLTISDAPLTCKVSLAVSSPLVTSEGGRALSAGCYLCAGGRESPADFTRGVDSRCTAPHARQVSSRMKTYFRSSFESCKFFQDVRFFLKDFLL